MTKLGQFVLYFMAFNAAWCAGQAAIDWHRFVSNPMGMLQGSVVTGLAAAITITILNSLPNRRRQKK